MLGLFHQTWWAHITRHAWLTLSDMLGSPHQPCTGYFVRHLISADSTNCTDEYSETFSGARLVDGYSVGEVSWGDLLPPASAVAEDDIPISPPTNSQKRREFSVSPCWGIVRRGATGSFHYRKDSSDGKVPQKKITIFSTVIENICTLCHTYDWTIFTMLLDFCSKNLFA